MRRLRRRNPHRRSDRVLRSAPGVRVNLSYKPEDRQTPARTARIRSSREYNRERKRNLAFTLKDPGEPSRAAEKHESGLTTYLHTTGVGPTDLHRSVTGKQRAAPRIRNDATDVRAVALRGSA